MTTNAAGFTPLQRLRPEWARHNGEREDMERAQRVLKLFADRTRVARADLAGVSHDDPHTLAIMAARLARCAEREAQAQQAYWGN